MNKLNFVLDARSTEPVAEATLGRGLCILAEMMKMRPQVGLWQQGQYKGSLSFYGKFLLRQAS